MVCLGVLILYVRKGNHHFYEHCNREYAINEGGAILRIHDRQKGGHGGDWLDPIRVLSRPHAWQSSVFPWIGSDAPLRRNAPRQSAAAVDPADCSSSFRSSPYLGIDSAQRDQERSATGSLRQTSECEIKLGVTNDD